MRIWFNKTFSTISAVFNNLRQSFPAGEITLICTHVHLGATAFLAADECYLEPENLKGDAYVDWCLNFCQQQRISLFWPGKEAALLSLQHAKFAEHGIQILSVADFDTLNLLHDKAAFYQQLPTAVAEVMDFIAINDLASFDLALAELGAKHPQLCIKPAVSVYGLGFKVLDTQRNSITQILKGIEYQIPLAELRYGMQTSTQFPTLLVMEHLAGVEWSVDCAGLHGELLCAVQRKKAPQAGYGQSIDNQPEIAGMVQRLTQHYRLNGIFNIQFKAGQHGPRLLEINPRPSGGFGMACLAGVNLAGVALQAALGQIPPIPAIEYGLRVSEVNTPVVLKSN
jgi:ATP-grasp in the biosynthetic pathway with Ter operon